jgi:hypothetical protein
MQGLFKKKTTVTAANLRNSFYKTIQKITTVIQNKESRRLIFESRFPIKRALVALTMLITCFFMVYYPISEYYWGDGTMILLSVILPFIGVFWALAGLFDRQASLCKKNHRGGIRRGIYGGFLFSSDFETSFTNSSYMITFSVGFVI